MSGFDCLTNNTSKVVKKILPNMSKSKLVNKSSISFERTASTLNSQVEPTPPPEILAKKNCTWCGSSNPITVVLCNTEHPSLKEASFCTNNCFEQFTKSLNTESIRPIQQKSHQVR